MIKLSNCSYSLCFPLFLLCSPLILPASCIIEMRSLRKPPLAHQYKPQRPPPPARLREVTLPRAQLSCTTLLRPHRSPGKTSCHSRTAQADYGRINRSAPAPTTVRAHLLSVQLIKGCAAARRPLHCAQRRSASRGDRGELPSGTAETLPTCSHAMPSCWPVCPLLCTPGRPSASGRVGFGSPQLPQIS